MKEYIEKIVINGNPKDMECLSDILVDLLYEQKENNVTFKTFAFK